MNLPSRFRLACLAPAVAAALVAAAAPAAAAPERMPARTAASAASADAQAEARVIVRFRASTDRARALTAPGGESAMRQARALSARTGIALADGPAIDARSQVMTARGMAASALAARLAAEPDVEWAVVDERQRIHSVPNDPRYGDGQGTTPTVGQWYLRPTAGNAYAAIDAQGAWALTTGNPDLVVAVIDTGVRFDHPDLGRTSAGGKLLPGYDFVSDTATANDGNGRDADPSDPGDWISTTENNQVGGPFRGCGVSDSSWHGTQTAGLVGAATDNGIGMAGSGRQIKVLPVRGLGKCGGFVSDIAAAMRWAGGLTVSGVPNNPNPARVINMSLGSANTCNPAYQSAIDELAEAGVVVVAAAGNDGLAPNQPSNCRGVVAVAGVRHIGTKVGYSNLGSQITVAAPAGNCVNLSGTCLYPLLTTSNTGTTGPGVAIYTDGDVAPTFGTSFASPLVAGTVGLMLSARPGLPVDRVPALLQTTAQRFPTTGADAGVPFCQAPTSVAQDEECYCTNATCGAGVLNAAGAVSAAAAAVIGRIDVTTTRPVAGAAVNLSAASTAVGSGRTVAAYSWTLAAGSAGATITGAANAATLAVLPARAGSFTAFLTVTDNLGAQDTLSLAVTVASSADDDDDGGGGGAMHPAWLLGLAVAAAALRGGRRRA